MVSTHSGMPATKGFSSPISVQGASTGKVPDFETYAQQFTPDEVVAPKSEGPKTFKFPNDDVTAGNFWTRLIVNSWVPVRPREELVDKQGHKLTRYHIANIWLPMPLVLGTAYNQTYTESDNMMVNRGSNNWDSWSQESQTRGWMDTFAKQAEARGRGATNEGYDFITSLMNVNNSGKMAVGSVMNQQMGLVYDGAALRSHTFSWRMTPRSKEEQEAISTIVFALKSYAAPIIMGPLGGEVNHYTAKDKLEAKTAEVNNASDRMMIEKYGGVYDANRPFDNLERYNVLQELRAEKDFDSMRNIGRLGIPATVNVEFWFGDAVNPNLFMIKDSFITAVEVNYTPTGTWNAYKDGSAIQTQVTLSLKENVVVAQHDIHAAGGY